MAHIEGYADFLVEITREKLGYDANDSSHDNEVLEKLQSGEKLSKSKHIKPQTIFTKEVDFVLDGIIIIDDKWYVDKESYDTVWKLYGDLLDKAVQLQYWFDQQGMDIDKLLTTLPSAEEINEKK